MAAVWRKLDPGRKRKWHHRDPHRIAGRGVLVILIVVMVIIVRMLLVIVMIIMIVMIVMIVIIVVIQTIVIVIAVIVIIVVVTVLREFEWPWRDFAGFQVAVFKGSFGLETRCDMSYSLNSLKGLYRGLYRGLLRGLPRGMLGV